MNKTGYPISYAAINKDNDVKKNSSSGGVFFLVAREVLNDGGVIFGAKLNEKKEIEHSFCDKLENLDPFLGSKYVQSNMNNMYAKVLEFLKTDRKVLFSGTPCQIYGLKSFLGKEYDNLYTIDLACHGVPSKLVWRQYLEENFEHRKIKNINFRDKTEGWQDYSLKIVKDNGAIYQKNRRMDSYLKGFGQNLYLRPSCYECQFKGITRKSDLTLADFWGIDKILPHLYDNRGASLVLIQSSKGKNLWDSIVDQLIYERVDIEDSVQNNSAILQAVKMPVKRNEFYKKIREGSTIKATVEELTKRTFTQKVKGRLKSLIK